MTLTKAQIKTLTLLREDRASGGEWVFVRQALGRPMMLQGKAGTLETGGSTNDLEELESQGLIRMHRNEGRITKLALTNAGLEWDVPTVSSAQEQTADSSRVPEERQHAGLELLRWYQAQHGVDEFFFLRTMGANSIVGGTHKWDTVLKLSDLEDMRDNGQIRLERLEGNRFDHRISLIPQARVWYQSISNSPQQSESKEAAGEGTEMNERKGSAKIFIGHGHHVAWKELYLMLTKSFKVEAEPFEFNSAPGDQVIATLERLLAECPFAFIIMTAEKQTTEGEFLARANLYHEAGLWQGKHGFGNAVILLDQQATTFSNNQGLLYIRFDRDNVNASYPEIHKTLKRWHLVS